MSMQCVLCVWVRARLYLYMVVLKPWCNNRNYMIQRPSWRCVCSICVCSCACVRVRAYVLMLSLVPLTYTHTAVILRDAVTQTTTHKERHVVVEFDTTLVCNSGMSYIMGMLCVPECVWCVYLFVHYLFLIICFFLFSLLLLIWFIIFLYNYSIIYLFIYCIFILFIYWSIYLFIYLFVYLLINLYFRCCTSAINSR